MGKFVAGPFRVEVGQAYDEYMSTILPGFQQALAEGKLPDSPGLQLVLQGAERLHLAMRQATEDAARGQQPEFGMSLGMTRHEYQTLLDVGAVLQNFKEVLTMRGAMNGTPSPLAKDALVMLALGRYEDEA
jgi:hypothetical protein